MSAGQTLHNGIRLSRPWPPQTGELTREPLATPPYLQKPPAVIPIDTGRQLFVDDFLIEETTLKRTYHLAEYQPANPVLKPDKPWETKTESGGQPAPTAMVFSDGVWYDPQDHLFKLWYMAGYCDGTAYATSKDGVHWEKPTLDGVAGTNLVHISRRDSGTVWLDQEETDAARRYKLFLYDSRGGMSIHFSPDGIHWTEAGRTGPTAIGQRCTTTPSARCGCTTSASTSRRRSAAAGATGKTRTCLLAPSGRRANRPCGSAPMRPTRGATT